MGVAVRMAAMDLLAQNLRARARCPRVTLYDRPCPRQRPRRDLCARAAPAHDPCGVGLHKIRQPR